MQEVAHPDGEAVEPECSLPLHLADREQSLREFLQHGACLGHELEAAQQDVTGQHDQHPADDGDEPPRRGETTEETAQGKPRLVEEAHEDGNLQHEDSQREQQDHRHIHHALRDHRAHAAGEVAAVVALQHPAAQYFAHARNHQRAGIAEEHRIDTRVRACLLAQRTQQLTPAQGTEHLGQDAEGERQPHPRPVHLAGEGRFQRRPVKAAVHPPQNGSTERHGEQNFED